VSAPTLASPAVGAAIDDAELIDSTGTPRRLSSLAAPGGLVLVFYRGAW
jgi:peroxiredoxin